MSRHASVEAVTKFLEPNPNLRDDLKEIAESVHALSVQILNAIPEDSAELTAGLRKLLEAKDCFVRAAV